MTNPNNPVRIWKVSDESRVDRNLVGIHIPGRDEFGNSETTCHLITTDQAKAFATHILQVVNVIEGADKQSPKFKVNDRVQPKWWPDNTLEEWKAGTILTVYEAHWDNVNGYWSYIVSDDIIVRGTTEDNLELFKE